jgi:hypothetical protein
MRSVFLRLFQIAAASIATSLMSTSATLAQTPRPELLSNLTNCRAISNGEARLACFDAAVGALDTAERGGDVVIVDRAQVRAARRSLFGFDMPNMPDVFGRANETESVDEVGSTLARAVQTRDHDWVFTLADGTVWRQVDTVASAFTNRPGTPVRVRRAAMGSYLLAVGRSPSIRVRRQQ